MGESSVARKEIAGEKEATRFTIVSGVPCGMAGEVNGPEPSQNGKSLSVFNPSIRSKRLKAQQTPAHPLETACDAIDSAARRVTEIAVLVRLWTGDPGAMSPRNGCGI